MTQLLNNKYKVIQEIGNGSIGKVFLCQFDDTQGNQIQVAVKQISDQTILGQQNKYLAQELNTIQMLIDQMNNGNKCDHVLQCYEIFQEQQQYYIVSEFCQLGDLYQYLYRNHQNLSTQNYLDIIIQIAKGIQYLHNINLGHRDLKPENILIRYNKGLQLVITDFGVSSFQNMKSTVGTINYMAPEILKFNQSYDKAVDIWSLGCIMHEIIYNEQLFNGNTTQQVVSKIRNFKLYQQIDQRPFLTDLNQIIQSCLSLDASYRPTIQDILNRLDELYSKIKNNEHIDQDQNQIINQQNGDQRYDQSNFTLTNTSFQTLNQNQTQQDNDFRQERTIQDNFLQKLIIECIQNDPINETQYREFQQNNEKQFVDIKSIEKYFKNFSNDLRSDE
ncbi:Serine/Threonine kinase domain protein (macronuclear) [Tetrahymena thermophila SB210]|uniref:Serine/Threonine kinase domain protein n=1 Tax=Tetrahymena thermophila (strain SB210) TaxID=312017 RepID=I7MM78_TETTS|nr:Serine/Threonine kinase domain protein [Tetrahymena thermophila SB210]EAS04320.2 Serine/Threonine kinase domain protein [Tetrahymena thermophila SB210]|eukprot:XP_001024565.2 Serine/Threonine kinase domain protein [Tetrahymena thermophila SB210]